MVTDILYTKREAFVIFQDGTISRHRGSFTEDPMGQYIHDVYSYPSKENGVGARPGRPDTSERDWQLECRNIDEMNAIARHKQRKEYYQRIASIRKQWRAQQPSWWSKVIARVRA